MPEMDVSTSPARDPSDPIELRHAATDRATIVMVPERRLLAIDGVGSPASGAFRLASATLRQVGGELRSRLHQTRGLDTRVGILECAWWIHPEVAPDAMADAFVDRTSWHWQQMLEIPSRASDDEAEAAIDATRQRAGREVPLVRLIHFVEGRAAQILLLGGVASEPDGIRQIVAAVATAGARPRGHLHELYLADPDQVPVSRARTILRLPIED
jgi:hypothetical protein